MIRFGNQVKKWLYVDLRVLALYRMVFGFLGILDVLRRYHLIEVFYSSSGMNFRRQVSSKYSIKYFSLLDYFQTTVEVQIFFIITVICFFCLMIGYRTKLFQILSAIGLISIHNAAVILENGGDMTFNNYLIWTMFLPLGATWSIDSLRKSFAFVNECNVSDLNKKIMHKSQQYFHFAYLACLVQLSMIYFYAGINKTATMWQDGTAVFYAFQLESFLTPIGELVSQYMNHSLSSLMTHSAPLAQLFAPIAILFPLFQPWLRRSVFIIFIGFHAIIEICFSIGLFGWVMFSALLLLLSKEDIDFVKSMLSRFYNRKFLIFYDRDCGFSHFMARLLKRMDVFSRLTWADRSTTNNIKNLDNILKTTNVIVDTDTGETWTRHKGFGKVVSALPLGFLFAWIFNFPMLEKIFGYLYDAISNNRIRLCKIMGLSVFVDVDEIEPSLPSRHVYGFEKINRKWVLIVSNVIVLTLLIGAVDYSTTVNKGFQKKYIKEEKKLKKVRTSTSNVNLRQKMRRILLYPRMHQNWDMFAPSVLRNEKWVIIEITFKNGEKLSLFREDGKVEENFEFQYFTERNQFWRKFFNRINKSGYRKHISQFKKWLKNTDYFPEYAGREVMDVNIWQLTEKSPKLGSSIDDRPKVRKIKLSENKQGVRGNKKNHINKTKKYKEKMRN